jgi:PAS domain S-box-containing protein
MLHKLKNQAKVQHSGVGVKLWLGWVSLSIAVGLAYFLTAQLGLALLTTAERVAVFWPASGIAVGILVALGAWARGPVVAGVIAATFAANILSDRNVWCALAFALCNAGEALLAMWLIERWFGHAFNLDNLRRVLGLFAAAAVATATAAVGASGAMKLFGPSTATFLDVWEVWFASDALGIITIAPLLIGVATAVREAPSWLELLEGTVAVAVTTATIGFLLAILSGPWSLIAPFALLFPLLLWLGYRCQPVFAAAAVFAIAAAIVLTTTYEFGRYGDPTQPIAIRVSAAQIAMLGTTLAALALAALFAERRRSEAALGESDRRLRSILDAANVIAWDVDLTSDIVHSAGPVDRLLQRPAGFLPGDFAAMVDNIHPGDRDSVLAEFWTAVSTGTTYRLEFRLNADRLCWVTAEGSVERDPDGRPLRVRGITRDITRRKRMELALAEREAQLALAGKAARVGSFAIDIATGRVHNSPGYAVIHGLAEGTDEFPREQWRARVHPDDLPQLDTLRSQAFAEQRREHNTEYRIYGSDGGERWIESRGLVSYDGAGHPIRTVGVNIDITERKRAQAALEESQARYRALYDDNPSMYFTVDASGTVLSVNEFGAQQLGYTPAQLIGQSVLEMIHEGDREKARRWLASCAVSSGTVSKAEMRKIRRDGSIIWVRKLARAVNGLGGQTLLIVCEDITERKEAELALAEREAQLGLAGKAARVANFIIDYATERIQTSPGFAAIHGLPEGTEELTCEEWRACVLPDDLERFEAIRSRVFTERRPELNIEYRIVGADGEARWMESRGLVSYDGDGRPTRLVGVHIDITERKRAEDQQCRLVAELDHRVKNVLATVQAVTSQTMQASTSMEHFVAALDGRIRSMGSTHELLSHRRWLGMPLAQLVERELAPYRTGSNAEIDGHDVVLSAEAGQAIGMVLHELVTNAAKHGALSVPSGRVSIRWRSHLNGGARDRLSLTWRETGGPLVVSPSKSGYGMNVIRDLVPYELGGTVDHVFAPEGARCQIEIPLAQLSGAGAQNKGPASADSILPTDSVGKPALGRSATAVSIQQDEAGGGVHPKPISRG